VAEEASTYFRREGVTPTSLKRQSDSVAGPATSDHWVQQRDAYAIDASNGSSENAHMLAAAKRICRHFGMRFQKNSYGNATIVTRDGRRFRVQVIYGAGVGHGDHVHVGVRAV
jgi:hypothetical protein